MNTKTTRNHPDKTQAAAQENSKTFAGSETHSVIREKQATAPQAPNNTGLPDNLKSGIENLSGFSMDDVRVHYNSAKPAQLQAHAYAQGTDIHVASGQEKHIPHEAWHVVQQKQGRVKPTAQLKGKVPLNDDAGLEKEADIMGARAVQTPGAEVPAAKRGNTTATRITVQRKINGKSTVNEIETILKKDIMAWSLYTSSQQLKDFINTHVTDPANDYQSYPNAHKPQELKINTPAKTQKLDSENAIIKWVQALYYSFFESDSGFTDQPLKSKHSSVIAHKDKHDGNWRKFVDERLAKIPLTINPVTDGTFISAHAAAQNAADELDRKELVGSTIKKDITADQKAIQDFADYVESKRDSSQSDVKSQLPQWKTESKYGTGVSLHAEFFPNITVPKGSGDDIKTPIDWFYESRKEGPSARYVKGHLLNDHVGGPAKNYNLSPLREQDNHVHDNGIEVELKFAVGDMQREVINNLPRTYNRIVYDVTLDAQSKRNGTAQWADAAQYLETCKALKATVQNVLNGDTVPTDDGTAMHNFSSAPAGLMTLLDALHIPPTTVLQNLVPPFRYNRLLWETEDYLVRPWYVRLLLDRTSGKHVQKISLANKKPEELGAHFILPEKGTTAHVWDEDTSRPGPHYDTESIHKDHTLRLEKELSSMSENDYSFYRYYLQKTAKNTLLGQLPLKSDPVKFYDIVAANATELADTLKVYRANSDAIIAQFIKERQEDTQMLTTSLLTMGQYKPQDSARILSNVSGTSIDPEKMSLEFGQHMGRLGSPERHTHIKSLGEEVEKIEQHKQGLADGKRDGLKKLVVDVSAKKPEYINGYQLGLTEGLKKAGDQDGGYYGFEEGHKYSSYRPQSGFSKYSDNNLNQIYRDAFSNAYKAAYKEGVTRLGEDDGKEDRDKNKPYNPWKPKDNDYLRGYDWNYHHGRKK